jgi:GNAT superfamily N-acetyltransferase
MGRHTSRITLDDLPDLAGNCHTCARWQVDGVRRRTLDSCAQTEELSGWVSQVLRDWGSCGRVLRIDGDVAGQVIYAPPVMVPAAGSFPTSPVSPDAVLMVSLRVAPQFEGHGVGRMLVQAMARDLIKRGGIKAVEAFGDTRGNASAECVIPSEFLLAVGFRTLRAHSRNPRMRMDLRTALTWRSELEEALDRLRGVVARPVANLEVSKSQVNL